MNSLVLHEDNSESRVFNYLKKNNHLFIPELSSKVSLYEYSNKISKFAKVFFLNRNNIDIAMAAFYVNSQTQKAYITSISIIQEYQKKGIGVQLLNKVEEVSKLCAMKFIELEVDKRNHQAISLYKKLGFCEITQHSLINHNSLMMLKKIS